MIHLTKAAYYLVQFIRQLIAYFQDPPVDRTDEKPMPPSEAP